MKTGYYIFYGTGDYHKPKTLDINWAYSWDFEQWKAFIDRIIQLKADTIMLYLNGHNLPYASTQFKELIDPTLRDKDLLLKICKYVKHVGLKFVAVLTTTGHAGRYAEKYPDLQIQIAEDKPDIEKTLICFPEHLRKGKLQKKEGAAQLGFGVLCHHKQASQNYALTIAMEIIELYGSFFDAIALHPPESAYPCMCLKCFQIYKQETGLNLTEESFENRCSYFIKSYLKFQNNKLVPAIQKKLPHCKIMQFTIPWFFEQNFEALIPCIPKNITLIEWDYNLEEARVNSLSLRLKKYCGYGYTVIFMPSAGFSINPADNVENQIHMVHQQIQLAYETNCNGIIHFIGPRISEYLDNTSYLAASNMIENNVIEVKLLHCWYFIKAIVNLKLYGEEWGNQ